MTTLTSAPPRPPAAGNRPPLGRLIRAEILKLRTTNSWWLFLTAVLVMTALAFAGNALGAYVSLQPPDSYEGMDAETARMMADMAAQARTPDALAKMLAHLLTSGQYFGLLFSMLVGVLVVTNEVYHQTATTTYTITPQRTAVIMGKLVAAIGLGGLFWAVSTLFNYAAAAIFLSTQDLPISLTSWPVNQAVLLNLLAFVVWGTLGLALGTLIRSQIGAVVTGSVLYLLGSLAPVVFLLIHEYLRYDWVLTAQVIAPSMASNIMITPGTAFEHAPPQWAGAAVLIGYAVLAGGTGIMITRRRDIS